VGEQQKAGKTANRALVAIFGVIIVAALAVFFLIYKPSFPALSFGFGGGGGGEPKETGSYVVLFKNLDYADAATIVESLKTQGVKDYRLEDDGRTILVPRKKRSEVVLNIAKEGIMPTGGAVGFEIFDKGGALGATDFDRQIKFSRAVGGELARSIAKIYGIEEARVQVVIPQKQLFQTQQNPVLASVFVKIHEDELLTPKQIQGIISLVASSVEDLRRENITVVDYFGRVLSSEEYAKDYDRLAAMLALRKAEQGRRNGSVVLSDDVLIQDGGKTADESSLFDAYRKLDSSRRERQDRSLLRGIRVNVNASAEDIYAAKMKFKERYEKLLERNIKQMANQFFPKDATTVKVNVELNNQPLNTVTPNSMIERITTMILLDQNNKDVVLTPEVREAFMKSIAASISYVKGRDRIDLRWAPKPNEHKQNNLLGWLGGGDRKAQDKPPEQSGKTAAKTATPSIDLSLLQQSGKSGFPVYLWYLGGGMFVILLLLFSLLRKKKRVVAESGFEGRASVFDEAPEEKEGFDDLTAPPVDKIKEMAAQSPEKIAAVLEKWLQEDNENK
jgi:flagellar biosynthesis/type III secretory pathway M-ring protein FliF/YscJ